MKKINFCISFLLFAGLLTLTGCSKNKSPANIFEGKTFTRTTDWNDKETYIFSKNNIATLTTETFDGFTMITEYSFSIDEENEKLNLKVVKYPYLENDEKYISLTLDELVERDFEGKADYEKIFAATISYKYLLMPSKLKLDNDSFEMMK